MKYLFFLLLAIPMTNHGEEIDTLSGITINGDTFGALWYQDSAFTVDANYSVLFSSWDCIKKSPTAAHWMDAVDSIEVDGKVIAHGELESVTIYYKQCEVWK